MTIRNLDDTLKSRLRLRAAARNRSMEEEARQILRSALQAPAQPNVDLGSRIRARFATLGGVLPALEPRDPVRDPPGFGDSAPSRAPIAGKPRRRP